MDPAAFSHPTPGGSSAARKDTLFLIERGRLPQPLLYLSSYIEARKHDYYDS